MNISCRAIVLHTTKYAESSIVAKLFTEQLGVVTYMINGVRSSRSKNRAAYFQPATILEIQATQRENKTLQRLTDFKLFYTYENIPFEIRKMAVAQLIIETLNRSVTSQDFSPELFEFSISSFLHIDKAVSLNPDFHLIYLLKLSAILGFKPNGNCSAETPTFNLLEGCFVAGNFPSNDCINSPYSNFISSLNELDITSIETVLPNGKARNIVLQYLLNYFRIHVPEFGVLKSPEVLKSVFE